MPGAPERPPEPVLTLLRNGNSELYYYFSWHGRLWPQSLQGRSGFQGEAAGGLSSAEDSNAICWDSEAQGQASSSTHFPGGSNDLSATFSTQTWFQQTTKSEIK